MLPSYVSLIEVSRSNGKFKENSVFRSVVDHLKNFIGPEIISVCTGQLPNWTDDTWENHFQLAKEKGSSVFVFSDQKDHSTSHSLQTFNVSELKMALDQNYRPNFEDLYQAYNMFGFKTEFFIPDNVVN